MTTTLDALRVVMSLTGIGLLGLAAWTYRAHDAPSLRPFVGLTAVIGTVAIADGIAAANGTTLSLVWLGAYLAIPAAFTWFVVEYYGLPYLRSSTQKTAFLLPVVVGFAGGSVVLLELSVQASAMIPGGFPESAPLWLSAAKFGEQIGLYYGAGVMILGVALALRTVAKYDHLDARLGVTLAFIPVWPWVAYLVTPRIVQIVGTVGVFTMTTSGYVLSGLAAVFAVTVGGLFDAAPAAGTLGPETVLSELDDSVIVVDREERTVRVNEAAFETFGLDEDDVAGRNLDAVLDVDLETLSKQGSVELETPEGSRYFEATVSPVRDDRERRPGHAVVVSDVTRERVRVQRLTVLNRVLRHNLRNEMTRIVGRAERIASESPEFGDSAEAILQSADDLVELGERAHQVEQMMSVSVSGDETCTVETVASRIIEEYRDDYPNATLTVDADSALAASADPRILARVLDQLVDNALKHNDAPTPVVSVSARQRAGGVHVSVSDNGPGLPEYERKVIESGTETALDHGSGLGLWAVNWGVTRLGGELEFTDNEPEGTVVTVVVPGPGAETAGETATAEAD